MKLNDTHKLIQAETGTEIMPGDPVTDFRSAVHVFRRITKIPGGPSQGKIITDRGHELYPSVFGLTIVPRDQES